MQDKSSGQTTLKGFMFKVTNGVGETAKSDAQNADAAIARIAELVELVGLKGKLSDFGISKDHLESLANDAVADAVTLNNPVEPTRDEVVAIMEKTL